MLYVARVAKITVLARCSANNDASEGSYAFNSGIVIRFSGNSHVSKDSSYIADTAMITKRSAMKLAGFSYI